MSDYLRPLTLHKASRNYRCAYCGERINHGTRYARYTGFCDGASFCYHFHLECLSEIADGDDELVLYSGDRPAKRTE